MDNLDKFDLEILRVLQSDGRISNQELADKISLSPSQCWRRVRQLEQIGIIRSYTTLLDPKLLQLNIVAFVHVILENHHPASVKEFEKAIEKWPEILECHATSGDYDFFLKIIAADLDAYYEFMNTKLLQIKAVRTVNTGFSLQQKKYTSNLPVKL